MIAHAGIIAHAGKYISLTLTNSHRSHKWKIKSKAHAKDKIILYSPSPEFILKSNEEKQPMHSHYKSLIENSNKGIAHAKGKNSLHD